MSETGGGPQRLWSWVWALLAFAIVVNVVWALLRPLMPVVAIGMLVVAGLRWWRSRQAW